MSINIKEEQVNELYRNALAGIAGHTLSAIVMIAILIEHVSDSTLFIWSAAFFLALLIRILTVFAYKKRHRAQTGHNNINKWIRFNEIEVFITSILWGLLTYLFADQFNVVDLHFLMMAVIFGLAGTALATLGIVFSVYVYFTVPMISMFAYHLFITVDQPIHATAALFSTIGLIFLLYTAFKYSRRYVELLNKTSDVERTQLDIIERLARAGEFRDGETGEHIKRMSYSSYLLALEYGFTEERAKQVLLASTMHDIGKIGIPDYILLKPGKLNEIEWDIMQKHTTIGAKILCDHESDLLKMAARIAGNHHEKWNGSGYPQGLAKQDIPIEARIVSICDVFDALTSERPYKKAWSITEALAFIKKESGQFFDPTLVELFLSISHRVAEFNHKHRDKAFT